MSPHLQVTEERLAGQYCVILRNNVIPDTRVTTIKSENQQEIPNQHQLVNQNVTEEGPELRIDTDQEEITEK